MPQHKALHDPLLVALHGPSTRHGHDGIDHSPPPSILESMHFNRVPNRERERGIWCHLTSNERLLEQQQQPGNYTAVFYAWLHDGPADQIKEPPHSMRLPSDLNLTSWPHLPKFPHYCFRWINKQAKHLRRSQLDFDPFVAKCGQNGSSRLGWSVARCYGRRLVDFVFIFNWLVNWALVWTEAITKTTSSKTRQQTDSLPTMLQQTKLTSSSWSCCLQLTDWLFQTRYPFERQPCWVSFRFTQPVPVYSIDVFVCVELSDVWLTTFDCPSCGIQRLGHFVSNPKKKMLNRNRISTGIEGSTTTQKRQREASNQRHTLCTHQGLLLHYFFTDRYSPAGPGFFLVVCVFFSLFPALLRDFRVRKLKREEIQY